MMPDMRYSPESTQGAVAWKARSTHRNSNDNLYVQYLYFNGDEVGLFWSWLGSSWISNSPALRFSK